MSNNRFNYADWMKDILTSNISFSTLKNDINNEDKAFVNMLFMTAFRQLTFIQKEVMPNFVKKKIPQKNNILEYILYLGITELLFMDTPSYAVLNSYVEIAKKKTDKFGANFVNAILRNVLRNKDELLKNRKTKYFSKKFIEMLNSDYSKEEIIKMENMVDMEVPLDVSAKQDFKHTFEEAFQLDKNTFRFNANTKITALDGFDDGDIWAQDFASSLPIKSIDNLDLNGKRVLDLCAAPGGKTAQLLDRGAIVTAVDISEERLNRLKENITRLKLGKNLTTICCDALDINFDKKFDIILVDAPCSATGTFRRHPEIIHTKKSDDVKKLVKLQKKILEKASFFVNDSGFLVYATCSLSKSEGEKQIFDFINNNPDYLIKKLSIDNFDIFSTKDGFLRVLPYHLEKYSGIDGFFVACLQKKN